MDKIIEVKVPDIGDFSDVPVIDQFVKVGDIIKVDDPICTLESDKAAMEVPSQAAGTVTEVLFKVGDKVSEGTVLIKLQDSAARTTTPPVATATPTPPPAPAAASKIIDVTLPDIGDFTNIPIIELFVQAGQTLKIDDPICTLESDKASMEVPSTVAGLVKEVLVKVGDKISQGTLLIRLEPASTVAMTASAPPAPKTPETAAPIAAPSALLPTGSRIHASPSIRAYARELGVDLAKITATGPKHRILKEDVTAYVKGVLSGSISGPVTSAAGGVTGGGVLDILPWPKVDFTKFGEVELKPRSRIQKISAQNLARNWVMIPAVTFHEDADITDLEAFRVQLNKENEKSGGAKLTMLAFLVKASVKALQKFPDFNSSLDGENLVLKKYFNIGFAADTPNGLMVPVIKNADQKSVFEIAQETTDLAKQARDGKLKPADMQGACFTISSLGGIGGTYFSPIINAPEVAILGVNKSATKPIWDGKQFVPRLILPLSLTADHRVIDGALATRFNVYLAQLLADFRRVTL